MYRMAGPVTYGFRQREKPDGTKENVPLDAGKNPANGVIFTYFLAEIPGDEFTLTILDKGGNEVRGFHSKKEKEAETAGASGAAEGETALPDPEVAEGAEALAEAEAEVEQQEPFLPKQAGINRFVWNFRAANATRIPGDKFSEVATAGPAVPPGRYTARLEVHGETFTESFSVLPDPRIDAAPQDLQAQYDFGLKIRDTMGRINDAVLQIRDLRDQLEAWEKRLGRQENAKDVRGTAKSLIERLTGIEEELRNTKATGRMMYPPPNVPTRLNQRLVFLGFTVASADAAPTRAAYAVFDELSGLIETQLNALAGLVETDIPAFNESIRTLQVPAVMVKGDSS